MTTKQSELTAPYDPNAEAACIGACMIDVFAYETAANTVRESDFYLHKHRILWHAITALYGRGDSLDEVTIESQLRATKELDDAGGMAYVIDLLTKTPTSANVDTYAKLVRRGAIRRLSIDIATRIAQNANDDAIDTNEAMRRNLELVTNLEALSHSEAESESLIGDSVAALYDEIEGVSTGETERVYIPSSFPALSELIKGYEPGQMITVAGRPGMGKSMFALNEAVHAARNGKSVAFFSLEMRKEQYTARMMSAELNIPYDVLRERKLTPQQRVAYMNAANGMADWNLIINTTQAITPGYLRSCMSRYQREFGLDIVFIDYLQLMSCGHSKTDLENEVQSLSIISRRVHQLAQEFSVPIVALAQLNRSLEARSDKRPMLSDLRGSGSIEQDSDAVMFLYRDCKYNDDADPYGAEVIIAKQREGAEGAIPLRFEGAFSRFVSTRKVTYSFNGSYENHETD